MLRMGSKYRLFEGVACAASLADLQQIVLLRQLLHMHLDGVAVCSGRILDFLDGDLIARLCQFEYLAG
jgi:hypothetical protein